LRKEFLNLTKSLVDPLLRVIIPAGYLGELEPEGDLFLCRFDRVRSMDNVSADINAEVTTNGARLRVNWFGGSKHFSTCLDAVVALPDHGANWARGHVFDKAWEEWLL